MGSYVLHDFHELLSLSPREKNYCDPIYHLKPCLSDLGKKCGLIDKKPFFFIPPHLAFGLSKKPGFLEIQNYFTLSRLYFYFEITSVYNLDITSYSNSGFRLGIKCLA